jgi:type IV pilus assembly protein PilQ
MFMRKWTRSAGLLFCAVASVYNGSAAFAVEAALRSAPDSPPSVKLISDTPVGDSAPSTQPSSQTVAGTKVSMNEGGTFSIQINTDISLVEVLRMIGNQAQISIIPSRDVRGTVPAMDLYNVTVPEALDAILHSNGMAWKQKDNLIYVYTQKELLAQNKAARAVTTEIFHLYYTPAVNAVNMIKPALSPDAQVSSTTPAVQGISSSESDAGGDTHAADDMVVVTDYPENLERVRKIIKEIDHRPQQILIEATIFQANLTENNALGIDFSLMGGVNFDTLLASGTPLTSALSGNILNPVAAVTGTGTGAAANTSANVVKQGYAGFTTGNYDTQVPAGGLQIGIVKDNLGVFLQTLEQVTDATVLANPKVLALDKQRGEVIVGNQFGYLTTTTTATTSTQTVQFLETGTRLLFRPFVGEDGYIRMEIHPEDSSGGLNSANLPFKTTTEVTSNVLVKDGNTIVIGGLFRESSQSNRSQVPFLGSIPLAGALFRSKTDSTTRQEIIILLTPHIIKDDAAYSKASEEEMKEAEKLRVGVRKGMMWFGRERLAESAYENAVAEMNKPHPSLVLALWYLNCATNLNPKFLEAIEMKEKITGKQVTDVDNSAIRSFVRRQVMTETPPPTTAQAPATRPSVATATTRPMQSPATKPSYAASSAVLPKPVTAVPVEPDDDSTATGQ